MFWKKKYDLQPIFKKFKDFKKSKFSNYDQYLCCLITMMNETKTKTNTSSCFILLQNYQ